MLTFTDVNQVERQETTYLDFTDMDSIRKMVKSHNIQAIVNSEVKKKKLNLIKR